MLSGTKPVGVELSPSLPRFRGRNYLRGAANRLPAHTLQWGTFEYRTKFTTFRDRVGEHL